MRKIFLKLRSRKSLFELGQSSFYIGSLFLSTTLLVSGIFFLLSLIISFLITPLKIRSNKWNLALLSFFILLLISSIFNFYFNDLTHLSQAKGEILSWDKNNIWTNLFKWLIMFSSFAGFEIYLKRQNQRLNAAKFLFLGCIPIIISCLMQRIFQIYGPFEFINGLIVFYLKPIDIEVGVTGIFNNPNYTGIWLSSLLPFSFLMFKLNRLKFFKSSFIVLTIVSTIYVICDTYSRNSFLGIFIAAAIMFSVKTLFITTIFLLFILPLSVGLVNFAFSNLYSLDFIPDKIFERLFETNYINKFQNPRIDIWGKAIKLIIEKPFLGWGAATFPILYISRGGFNDAQHTHNMILEIAQIHGIPVAFFLTIFISLLFYKTSRFFLNKKYFFAEIDRAWLAASLIIVLSHLTDITQYEGRINLLIWILLCGLKCIVDTYNENIYLMKRNLQISD